MIDLDRETAINIWGQDGAGGNRAGLRGEFHGGSKGKVGGKETLHLKTKLKNLGVKREISKMFGCLGQKV